MPAGLTYTVYGPGTTLPVSLTGAGITAPGEGGSLLVATINDSSDIFFTLKIGVDGQYVFPDGNGGLQSSRQPVRSPSEVGSILS